MIAHREEYKNYLLIQLKKAPIKYSVHFRSITDSINILENNFKDMSDEKFIEGSVSMVSLISNKFMTYEEFIIQERDKIIKKIIK